MIVKGHDFSKVTLVGALAADLSLYALGLQVRGADLALLTQAAGRAGRGQLAGNVVIQTYQPDHYSIRTAATQDYESFTARRWLQKAAGLSLRQWPCSPCRWRALQKGPWRRQRIWRQGGCSSGRTAWSRKSTGIQVFPAHRTGQCSGIQS